MGIDDGKQLYDTFTEAQRIAEKMSRSHGGAYQPYKIGSSWAVGGIHLKTLQKKVKSFDDIRLLLEDFRESDEDNSVEDYINDIETTALTNVSVVKGESDSWILEKVALKQGCELGMSPSNVKTYLALFLYKNGDKLTLKMGGQFSSHIPLIKKQCECLINQAVVWHTWNSSIQKTNWGSDEWFYRIQAKSQL